MILIMWIVKINEKICVEASKVLLSKKSTKVKSTIECKCKVLLNASVKINLTIYTNTLTWVYTNTFDSSTGSSLAAAYGADS